MSSGDIIHAYLVEEIIYADIVEEVIDVSILEETIAVELVEETILVDMSPEIIEARIVEETIIVEVESFCNPCGDPTPQPPSDNFLIFDSDGSLTVGDLIYQSLTLDKYAIKVIDNLSEGPVLGRVLELLTGTEVKVLPIGEITVDAILLKGKNVFISAVGEFTSTVPLTGYVQFLGVALTPTSLYLDPELIRTKRA